ncbi:MAG: PAS domain S-box protein, partial [Methanomicrobiales archaeon]|nr:PAS domain S-box protein [Methanomicrobiales archaeon]
KWADVMHPDSREPEVAMLAELSRTGMPVRYETNYIRKDGSTVPVETFVHRVTDDDGNIRYFYGFITDITGRKHMEELLQFERDRAQQYLDTAGLMLAALDREGTITLMNRRGSKILGWPDGELIGKNWMVTCLPERIRDDVKRVLDGILGKDPEIAEYRENAVLTKDGKERILAFHNTPIKDANGTVTGILFSGEDITLRCQAEKDLQESGERFRNLIQNASDMIRIIGRDGLIAYSSPSTFRITGLRPSEVMGKNPLDFVHPDDRKAVTSALAEVIDRTNPGEPTEYRIRHADGTYIEVEAVATNLFDVAGINGIVTTTRPITERKRAEQAILESEGRYRAIFEQSPDAMVVVSDHVIDCNPAAERLFGLSRDELINSPVDSLYPLEQPGSRPSAEIIAEYLQAARNGQTQVFPFVLYSDQHREFPAELSLIPARIRGEDRIIAIIHDLSEQDKTKEQIRHLARFPEHSPHPVIEMTEGRDITWANPASFAVLQKAGMPADPAAFIPADLPPFSGTETMPVIREVQIGQVRYRETLVYDPDDRRVRIFAYEMTDLDMLTGALAQANRKLSRLASITRHDIKNKLTGVMGYLELAKGSTKDPDMIEYLTRAEVSATAVRQQIEFTKEYDKLGMNPPAWQEISPLLAAVQAQLGDGAFAVRDESAGLAIFADPLLEKVLYCLLENARAHGGNVSAVHIHGDVVPDGYLLVVEDDGTGIPEERKEKIFNKNVDKGSGGFGLFLSREVLSITGITIEERGREGEGARFEIFIPAGKFRGDTKAQ